MEEAAPRRAGRARRRRRAPWRRRIYARALYEDAGATLDDLREAVTTYEEIERTARRVFGSAHPLARKIEADLRMARAALRANEETQP